MFSLSKEIKKGETSFKLYSFKIVLKINHNSIQI